MEIIRFEIENSRFFGVINGNEAEVISSPFNEEISFLGKSFPLDKIKLLAPTEPTKIVAAGLNYQKHTEELKEKFPDEPVFFIKPSTTLNNPFDDIPLYKNAGRTDYEGELAVVIKKECRNVSPEEVKDYILGYTILNDVTARTLQKKDGQWTRAKGFDGFCPIGPHIETELNTANLSLKTYKDGVLVQDGNTCDMIWSAEELVSFASSFLTLLPGDVVSTGTPSGIGEAKDGETVEIEIEGIGILKNTYKSKE